MSHAIGQEVDEPRSKEQQGLAMLTEALQALRGAAAQEQALVEAFKKKVYELLQRTLKCLEALRTRSGSSDELDAVLIQTKLTMERHKRNQDEAMACINYLVSGCDLSLSDIASDTIAPAPSPRSLHASLCAFCKVHIAHAKGSGFRFELTDGFADEDDIDGSGTWEGIMGKYYDSVGARLYSAHGDAKVSTCFAQIMLFQVDLAEVHDSVLCDAPPDKKLVYLIKSPLVKDDLVAQPLAFDENTDRESIFGTFAYNEAFMFIEEFSDVVSLQSVAVPQTSHPDKSSTHMPIEMALFLARLICRVRDLATIAAHVHDKLMLVAGAGEIVQDTLLNGQVAHAMRLFQDLIVYVEGESNSDMALSLERAGWQLPHSVCQFRVWAKLMGCWGAQALQQWLKQVSRHLHDGSAKCAAQIPSWSAVFEEGKLLEPLASKVLGGKLPVLINAHNTLHSLMSQFAASASTLSVSPRLQDNAETIESARVSFDTLGRANQASIVVMASELITKFQSSGAGIAGARSFLQKYKRSDFPALPQTLWVELESIAAHGEEQADDKDLPSSPAKRRAPTASPSQSAKRPAINSPESTRPSSEAGSVPSATATPGSGKKPGPPTITFSSKKSRRG